MFKSNVFRKFFGVICICSAAIAMTGCAKEVTGPTSTEGVGTIQLMTTGLVVTEETRASQVISDYDGWSAYITSDEGINVSYEILPDGKIRDVPAGDIILKLTNYETFILNFNDPRFEGVAEVNIQPNAIIPVPITAYQVNAGLFFEYDEEALAAAGFADIVPTVHVANGQSLKYVGDNRNSIGYFRPGNVMVNFTSSAIDGEFGARSVTLEGGDLYKITLSVSASGTGLAISLVTITPDEPTFEDDWNIDAATHLTLTSYELDSITPEQYEETTHLTVTGEISDDAWENLWGFTNLETLVLRDQVYMPDEVFSYDNVNNPFKHFIATNVTTVGNQVFAGSENIESIFMPNAFSVGEAAFRACRSLTTIELPGMEYIDEEAFGDCTSLRNVDISSLTEIVPWTFSYCEALTSINAPSATIIGHKAFTDCTALVEASFYSATTIEEEAFENCSSLSYLFLGGMEAIDIQENAFFSLNTSDITLAISAYGVEAGNVDLPNKSWGGYTWRAIYIVD